MSDFEERCKRQYEQRFETYQKKTEEQLRAFTDQRLKEQEREAEQVAVLQQTVRWRAGHGREDTLTHPHGAVARLRGSQIREMQMQTEKWRAEYVAEVERRSEAAMAAMEERYVSQLAEAHRELAELREERGREATQVQKVRAAMHTLPADVHSRAAWIPPVPGQGPPRHRTAAPAPAGGGRGGGGGGVARGEGARAAAARLAGAAVGSRAGG